MKAAVMTPFAFSRAERVTLAKQQYFDEGILPAGTVSDAVFQSWARCYRAHQQPADSVAFQPVSNSRKQLAQQKNRVLQEAWLNELPSLETALGAASCSAILTDASGVVLGLSPVGVQDHQIMSVAHRTGINLSEEHVGTTAPGIVARTGKAACVLGSEHFYEAVSAMHCAAAPIRNIHGQLAGILNIASEGTAFQFDPAAVVGMYAASIENRFLIAQSLGYMVIRFQFMPTVLQTPMAGILGFDLAGKLIWVNSVASNLLGIQINQDERSSYQVEDIFDTHFSQLASLTGKGITPLRLNSGLQVFLQCEILRHAAPGKSLEAAQERSIALPVPDRAPATSPLAANEMSDSNIEFRVGSLKQADADLIQRFLRQFNGNVSMVARHLKVSRGLIYRRIQELGINSAEFKKK
jgi:sigma-54 dependent transcriptional regulator, acetoin dehydrogenase operon transcriptional activator AcoR